MQTATAEQPKTALAPVPTKPSLVSKMAGRFGVDADKLMTTLKTTAFKVKGGEATNEQMMALLIVADQYNLNPFTKEIYAFPDKFGGIVPIVGVDGWARIINENGKFDGMEFENHYASDGSLQAITCTMHRSDRQHPTKVTELLAECKLPTDPWATHPSRMLRHKAMIQCARIAFGFVGIYDEDEAQRIIEGESGRVPEQPTAITAINGAVTGKPVIEGETSTPQVTFTLVADKLQAAATAKDIDLLDAHATLIVEAPEDQQEGLTALYKKLRAGLAPT